MFETIKNQAATALRELLAAAKLKKNDLVVIGCSSSEVIGSKIGTASSADAAKAVYEGLIPMLKEQGLFCAIQCCEHLNRALIVERACLEHYGWEEVNVIPHAHAGGAFATECYHRFQDPVAVESIRAHAGIDIGDVLIGMHIMPVAVPFRSSVKSIGSAHLTMCRRRPKFVGGARAIYKEELL
jgi:uncharacterized protein (TIGR01440 family)